MNTRVSIDHQGNISEQSLGSPQVHSSNDYVPSGTTVRSTKGIGGSRTVQSADQIADSDLVVIDGMEITAAMARSLGLMNHVIDPGLSAGAAAAAAQAQAETKSSEGTVGATGHEGFDATTAELEARIEAGDMGFEEASEYQTAAGEIALSGLTVTEITEAIDGMRDGTVGPMDLDSNTRAIVQSVEAKVTATATASAKAELGPDGFNRLAEMAKASPEVNAAIRQYAGMRALGRADASWTEFLADAEDHVRGIR